MSKGALLELADRVEAAEGPNWQLENDIADALFGKQRMLKAKPYTASIDAALSLLPDTEYSLTNLYGVARVHVEMANEYGGHHGEHLCGSMPHAIAAAALRALAYANAPISTPDTPNG